MKKFINYNGTIYEEGQAVLAITDHSYRYGDGLFETMKMMKGEIMFKDLHFERLYSGLKILKFNVPPLFTKQNIEDQIKGLCRKNNCGGLARLRLSVSRGSGGLYDCDNKFSYVIGCWPLEQKSIRENAGLAEGQGLVIDIFPDARKSIDAFSNLKSANYLPYVMAAVWARENRLDDALILNQHNRICDATIANVFWIKTNTVYTPPLSEGCVAGVMRRRILDLGFGDFTIKEAVITEDTLLNADEVFLTNVTTGIRWVQRCGHKVYSNTITSKIFTKPSNN
jgi:branched-chain amino acid aminotransferase